MQAVQKVTSKARTFVLAFVLALSAIGITTLAQPGSAIGPQAASAAVIGKPGCIKDLGFRFHHINPYGSIVFHAYCVYRTPMGTIINNYDTGSYYVVTPSSSAYYV